MNLLQLKYPIIQAPMLGITTPEMAAAISNEGGLGSLPVGGLSPETAYDLIQKTKQLTNKPFAVNLFAHKLTSYSENDVHLMAAFLVELAKKRGYELTESAITDFKFYTYADQIDVLIKENIKIVNFTFGCLDKESVRLLKNNGAILIGTATCLEEALFLENEEIDMVCLQGIEAGAHRGTFIEQQTLPQLNLLYLISQVKDKIKLPVIAAGGIDSSEKISEVLRMGAVAAQIGTAFLGSAESLAIESFKNRLSSAKDKDTVLTRAFSGRWARGIRNEMMTAIETSGLSIPPYPVQNSLTAKFRKLAQDANDSEYTSLWVGQSVNTTKRGFSKDIFQQLLKT